MSGRHKQIRQLKAIKKQKQNEIRKQIFKMNIQFKMKSNIFIWFTRRRTIIQNRVIKTHVFKNKVLWDNPSQTNTIVKPPFCFLCFYDDEYVSAFVCIHASTVCTLHSIWLDLASYKCRKTKSICFKENRSLQRANQKTDAKRFRATDIKRTQMSHLSNSERQMFMGHEDTKRKLITLHAWRILSPPTQTASDIEDVNKN